jgi:hypothetical protein
MLMAGKPYGPMAMVADSIEVARRRRQWRSWLISVSVAALAVPGIGPSQLYGTVRNATDMAEHDDVPKHTAYGWIRPADRRHVAEHRLGCRHRAAARVPAAERGAPPHPALRARGGQRAGWRRAPAVLWRIPLVGEKAGERE